MINNSTSRFSSRVDDYVRYRPSYPAELIDFFHRTCGVADDAVIADIGAGTGISTRMLLDAGHPVVAVEPNADMRAAADHALGGNPRYGSVAGTAEATTLDDASVDLVTAFQAFHWFNPQLTRLEFARILRPSGLGPSPGLVALVWNSRRLNGSAFLRDYENLLRRYALDYTEVAERYADDASMDEWFQGGLTQRGVFDNVQRLDFDGLAGRVASASYVPKVGHPNYEPMMAALREVFDADAENGMVDFVYDTRAYVGTVSAA